jgi:3-dehydroquinate synthase
MAGLIVYIVDFSIDSHRGPYFVNIVNSIEECFKEKDGIQHHYLVDTNVADIYRAELMQLIDYEQIIEINATEENKSIENIIPIIKELLEKRIKRNHILVGIGGGIMQDITCFIASNLMRGMEWKFIPTTLLSQADSCIGSKSSVNIQGYKNILGTFNPPVEIFINKIFLKTLKLAEIKSGIGEIFKAHAIDSAEGFNDVAENYDAMLENFDLLQRFIAQSLNIKKKYIEIDEFDKGIRNIFNYGHSFGHAIESVTSFMIPHGIAVSIGMDIANYVSYRLGLTSLENFEYRHIALCKNYEGYSIKEIQAQILVSTMSYDKKNIDSKLNVILPNGLEYKLERVQVNPDQKFVDFISDFLNGKFK